MPIPDDDDPSTAKGRDREHRAETDEEAEQTEREKSPLDDPGRSGGTAGTGGVNKTQDP
ncbi:MAG: hypothetical protein RLN87_09235 [Parasphingopyxis sp.]|uniref:hypothetical protein n=1 Tax=Parasphingopyxis sp. TaxID=1920299 RepID=UPI0032ECCBB5